MVTGAAVAGGAVVSILARKVVFAVVPVVAAAAVRVALRRWTDREAPAPTG